MTHELALMHPENGSTEWESLAYAQGQHRTDISTGVADYSQYDSMFSVEPLRLLGDYRRYLGRTDQPPKLANIALMDRHEDFTWVTEDLLNYVNDNERHETYTLLGELTGKAGVVSALFPPELKVAALNAYGEITSSILYTLHGLKSGIAIPNRLPLGDTGEVKTGTYKYEDVLRIMGELDDALGTIAQTVLDNDVPVERLNNRGTYGMYRLGVNKNVLATVRLLGSSEFDSATEFKSRFGTEASIGYTVERDHEEISMKKSEQRDTFCIRIDNSDDHVALDVGSILGRSNTLGKEVADVIAIGDMIRSNITKKNTWLNHNKGFFEHQGLEDREVFARIMAGSAEALERRVAMTRVRQLALKQTVAS